MAIFALLWMFCGYIFAINLFVGVVVDNFSRLQRENDGSATMTREQKQWVSAKEVTDEVTVGNGRASRRRGRARWRL